MDVRIIVIAMDIYNITSNIILIPCYFYVSLKRKKKRKKKKIDKGYHLGFQCSKCSLPLSFAKLKSLYSNNINTFFYFFIFGLGKIPDRTNITLS